jgi:hypothetical protein
MTGKEKKQLILKKIAEGDKRSYNQIAADLELQIWTEWHKGAEWTRQQLQRKLKQ